MTKLVPYSAIKPESWPPAWRQLFELRAPPPRRLEKRSAAATWRNGTFGQRVWNLGYFLGWLHWSHRYREDMTLAQYVTQNAMEAYVDHLETFNLSPRTIANRVESVGAAMSVLSPEVAVDWLASGITSLRNEPSDRRRTRERSRHTADLVGLGVSLMRQALDPEWEASDVTRAIACRDGLIIAFDSLVGTRLSPLRVMAVGQHLIPHGPTFKLHWSAAETKSGQPYDATLPPEVAALFHCYLSDARFRPMLERQSAAPQRAVWLSRDGAPLSAHAIYELFIRRTEDRFGVSVYPHAARHSACTTLALERPDLIEIITPLLHHVRSSTRELYNLATSLEAGQSYSESLHQARFGTGDGRRLLRALMKPDREEPGHPGPTVPPSEA
jgi:integrase